MKNTVSKLLTLCLAALTLWSCEKDEDRIIIKSGTKPVVTASQTNLMLTEEEAGKDAFTLTWTRSDFGYDAAVDYTIEIAPEGSDFTNAEAINMGSTMVKTFKVGELNMIANKIGMEGFTAGEMQIRVRAEVGDVFAPALSDVVTLSVTPYLSEPEFPVIYMVGAASEFDWDNTKATPFFRDPTDPFVYTYTGYLKSGDFKLLGYRGKWGPAWGQGTTNANGTVNLNFRPSEGDPDVPNFSNLIPAAGYYTVTVSLRNNTISIEPFGAGAGAQTFASMGVVGAFTDWGGQPDKPLTKTANNPHIWSGTITLANPSELKFRANSDWGNNWGADTRPNEWYDKGRKDGPNIVVPAGTYQVFFNDLTAHYVLIKQ
ncbi:MAG: SusE domain-containing protein [Rufibacter sp.]